MAVDVDSIRRLNQQTGVGLTAAKAALVAAGGDLDQAAADLKAQIVSDVADRSDRPTVAGLIASYVHDRRIGVLVEINCETDFAAKSDHIAEFAKNISLQVAASSTTTVADLLAEDYIKAGSETVADYCQSVSGQMGENLVIRRICRWQLSPAEPPS